MENIDIVLIGVGGQGIGLLSEVILRAADHAGFPVRGVDTHGLAQRGGTVNSHVRIGGHAHSPLVREGRADVVIALERTEALRAMNQFLRDEGVLVYYNTSLQPVGVRMGVDENVDEATVSKECKGRRIQEWTAFREDLPDARMQNVVLLGIIAREGILPGILAEHYRKALADLLSGATLGKNRELFSAVLEE